MMTDKRELGLVRYKVAYESPWTLTPVIEYAAQSELDMAGAGLAVFIHPGLDLLDVAERLQYIAREFKRRFEQVRGGSAQNYGDDLPPDDDLDDELEPEPPPRRPAARPTRIRVRVRERRTATGRSKTNKG